MGPGGAPQNDPLALASIGVGVFSLITCFCCGLFGLPFPIAAVVLGVLSMNRINKEPDRYTGKNLAIAGIAVGAVSLVLTIVMIFVGVGANLMQNLPR
jgi:Na+/proline symporter